MKIWAFCVFMPQKLQDMSSFLGFGGNSALLQKIFDEHITKEEAYRQYCDACNQQGLKEFSRTTFYKRIKDRSADYNRGLDAIMTLKYNYGEEIQLDFILPTIVDKINYR